MILLLVLVLGAKVLNAFSRAIIQVTLHQETKSIDTILKAGQSSLADLGLETIELKVTKQKTAQASGVEIVKDKASGTIVIYNTFSSQPQTLIENTRFETSDGKIYRINKKITVPGAIISGGETEAGSIEAVVYADKSGDEYNIGLSDFTIPGFKGGPRYEKFYARSKTPMTGGFEGERPVVKDGDFNSLKNLLEAEITTELMDEVSKQVPEEFLMYEEASSISFKINQKVNQDIANSNEFTLEETGTLFAYLLSEENLSKALAKKYLGEDMQQKVKVKNLSTLNFDLISENQLKNIISFKLSGEAIFIWVIDEEDLKEALVASSEDFENVFSSYPAIDNASILFKPSWWRFFPNTESRIRVEPTN